MEKIYTILLLLMSISLQGNPGIDFVGLGDSIQNILDETEAPGLQVAIFTGDSILWVQNFGYADVAAQLPVTDETFFRIGSITKTFVAVAALQLVERGRLRLDDRLRDLAPDIEFENDWQDSDPITIAHLLEHTTGFDDFHLKEYAVDADGWSLKEGIDFHPHNRTSRWKPGMHSSYCNAGPPAVAYVIEKTTGQDFEAYVAEHIFRPLGMTNSSFILTPHIASNLSKGYLNASDEAKYWHVSQRPAGSINSNAREMIRFVQMLINGGTLDSIRILSPGSVARMESCHTTLAGAAGVKGGYGLHNYHNNHRGLIWHGHNGGMMGFLANAQYNAEIDIGWVLLVNCTNAAYGRINRRIEEHLYQSLKQHATPLSASGELDPNFLGHYQVATSRNQMLSFIDDLVGRARFAKTDTGYVYQELLSSDQYTLTAQSHNTMTMVDERGRRSPVYFENKNGTTYSQQVNWMINMKKVSAVRYYLPVVIGALFLLSLALLSGYALVWMILRLTKVLKGGAWSLRLLPAIIAAVLGLTVAFGSLANSGDVLSNLGTMTPYSLGITLGSLLFAFLVAIFAFRVFITPRNSEHRGFVVASRLASVLLLIVVIYLTSEGIIGLRTWAY